MADPVSVDATTTDPVTAMPSTFRMAHCMADGQLTPPESPDAPNRPTTKNGPRLQLTRLLRRTRTDPDQSHLSVRRASPVRPYVSAMKAPFQLRLPDSPIDSDCSSSSSSSPVFAPKLRPRAPTYHDLRSLAARQKEHFSQRVDTPLLPSPIEKGDMIQSDSYFTFTNPRQPRPEYNSYQDLHILSCYCDKKVDEVEQSPSNTNDDKDERSQSSYEDGSDSRSISTIDTPVTPEEQIYRISTVQSDESGWLANDTSVTEREKKFKARCFQVVQQPSTEASRKEDVTVVRIAGPGRPKLVQISRPTSISTISTARRASMIERPHTPTRVAEVSAFSPYDTPYTHIEDTPIGSDPSRPRLHITVPTKHRFSTCSLIPAPLAPAREAPATPSCQSSSTAFSSTMEKLVELSDPFGSSPESHRTICTESIPNSSTASISTSAWPIPPRNILRRLQHTRSPAISGPRSESPSSSFEATPRLHASPPTSAPSVVSTFGKGLSSLASRLTHVRHTLSTITAAINAFPNNILRLDSPGLQGVRNPHILDTTYTEALAKIFPPQGSFPQHRPLLLSALAAWLIIDLWFEKMIMSAPASMQEEPLTAYDVLRMHHSAGFWNADTNHDADSESEGARNCEDTPTNEYRPPTATSTTSLLSAPMLQPHYTSSITHLNSPLKRIPTKARSLLGITTTTHYQSSSVNYSATSTHPAVLLAQQKQHLADQERLQAQQARLTKRLRMVRPAANVIVQKLVMALRQDGWDEDLGMCLRVLVGVVEGSPGGVGSGWLGMDMSWEEHADEGGDEGGVGPGPAVLSDDWDGDDGQGLSRGRRDAGLGLRAR